MAQINLAEAQTHFLEIIQKALLGEEVIIADNYRPLVQIVSLSAPKNKRVPGSGSGQLQYMADDFNAPLEDFEEYQ